MQPGLIARQQLPRSPLAHQIVEMHGERTRVDIFTRVPDARRHRLKLGGMELVTMRCGSMSIRREARDVRLRPNAVLTFVHQVRGQSTFSHYGRKIELDEGDFTLCNNSRQYDLTLYGPNEVIFFRIPTPIVRAAIPTPDLLCGHRLPRNEGLAPMAAAMIRHLSENDPDSLAPELGERAGRHILDVLATSYTRLPIEQCSATALTSSRLWKAKLFIEEHLRDPELDSDIVARHLNLSSRYLRMIFAEADESPSTYILRRRLEECAEQLADPRWRQDSITSIAFGWGFNSAPHFARSFRARFGCSPRDYRRRHDG